MARSTPKYDVFLNHRGPDTKKSFVIPLEQQLREEGISAFLDRHNIHHGDNLFKNIKDSIKSAHLHIAIFSRNYAHSTYCLDELDQMYQMSLPERKSLIPVFYDVKPEHVRRPLRQGGPFEEAFKKHEEREKPEDVQRWVRALQNAAEIKGFDRTEYSDDYQFRKQIVFEVMRIKFQRMQSFVIPIMVGIYSWVQHYQLPNQGEGFVSFGADCTNDVHVAISREPRPMSPMEPMYEIVIGGWSNTRSVIRRRSQGPILCEVPVGLIRTEHDSVCYLWVSIDSKTNLIQVGYGKEPDLSSVFCIYKDINFIHEAQYVSFSSWDVPVTYSAISVASLPSGEDSIEHMFQHMMEIAIMKEPSNLRFMVPPKLGLYNWVKPLQLPEPGRGFLSFGAQTYSDVHIAISSKPREMDPMYEIVVGGWSNTKSVIRRRSQGPNLCTAEVGLIEPQNAVNYLWVSIDKHTEVIQVGHGKEPNLSSVFCIYKDVDFLREAQYVSFTSWEYPVIYSAISVASLKSSTSELTDLSAVPSSSANLPKPSCQVM
ncbi:hypothetical protein M758_6G096100 [Ceratodon purpureus]|nr:hypothetical protein M758_6G096100 [Ceratodon purpureus]